MKIKSLHLKNFRQFRDFKIEFNNEDPQKNVTVIRAKNSTGKTTLAQSILWCLYGEEQMNLDLSEKIINKQEVKDAVELSLDEVEYSVEMAIIDHKNISYLTRTQSLHFPSLRKKKETVEFAFVENGERFNKVSHDSGSESMKVINRKINSILSQDIANNFVFDGERIEKIADTSKKIGRDEISNAISSISLVPTLKNSLSRLDFIAKRLRKDIAEEIGNEVVEIENRITLNENNLEDYRNTLDDLKLRERAIESEIDKINQELLNFNDISKQQERKLLLQDTKQQLEDDTEKLKKNIYAKYTSYLTKREIYKLHKKYEYQNIIDTDFPHTIPHMTVDSINYLIDKSVCVCGSKIDDQKLLALEEQKRHQPPESKEGLIKGYEADVKVEVGNIDELVDEIKNLINDYDDKMQKQYNYNVEIREIEGQIGKSEENDIRSLQQESQELSSEKTNVANEIIDLESNIKENIEDTEQLKIDYQEAKKSKFENDKIQAKKDIVQGAIETLQEISTERKSEIREAIQEKANHHFKEIISKNKSIILNEDFAHKIVDSENDKTAVSSGESIAVSISIILAIIETHKNRIINHKNDIESHILTDKEFFLVMDGPFAVLDQHFSETISFKLANTVEQIILLTNDNQYNDSVKKALVPKLSKEYILHPPLEESENLVSDYLEVVR